MVSGRGILDGGLRPGASYAGEIAPLEEAPMSHAAHITHLVEGLGYQVAGMVVGTARRHAAVRESRRLSDLEAVERLVAELDRARRLAAQAQAETRRLRAEIAVHANEAVNQRHRAERAETACVRYATALGIV